MNFSPMYQFDKYHSKEVIVLCLRYVESWESYGKGDDDGVGVSMVSGHVHYIKCSRSKFDEIMKDYIASKIKLGINI